MSTILGKRSLDSSRMESKIFARQRRYDTGDSLSPLLPQPVNGSRAVSGQLQMLHHREHEHEHDVDCESNNGDKSMIPDEGIVACQYPNPWVKRCEFGSLRREQQQRSNPETPNTNINRSNAEPLRQRQRCQTEQGATMGQTKAEAPVQVPLNLIEIVKLNFINYCQTTSLRGVPKIVKTKEHLLKYIWVVFTFAFFFGCFLCLALIINQYLAYDVIHQPRTVRNKPVQFPSFTVCNTRPFSQAGIELLRSRHLMMPKEYNSFVIQSIRNTGEMSGGYNDTIKEALSTIFESKGYFENMPSDIDITNLGHTLDQTILVCEGTVLDEHFKRSKFCELIGTWTRTYDNKFLNCYTFTADAGTTEKILTVRIMAYTNERNLTTCPDCSSFPATQVSGLRVQLHNAGNYPEVQEEGLNIRPGSLTEIRFETKQWLMKEPPHGRCSRKVPPMMRFNNNSFTYSYQVCKKKMLHEQIKTECGCLDSTIPLPDTMSNTGLSYCGRIPGFSLNLTTIEDHNQNSSKQRQAAALFYNISLPKTPMFIRDADFQDFLSRISCNTEIFKAAGKATDNRCFTPCTYYTYSTTISTTDWPTRAYMYEMVDDFKKFMQRIDSLYARKKSTRNSSYLNPIYRRLSQTYGPVKELAKNDSVEAEKMLRSIDYIERNFIEILINRGKSNFDIETIEEKPVISLTSLLSQIGGLLSIWVGLTFVCIVEIVDLIYNIVSMYSMKKNAAVGSAS